MSIEIRLAVTILVASAALIASWFLGVWMASADDYCLTVSTPYGVTVACTDQRPPARSVIA